MGAETVFDGDFTVIKEHFRRRPANDLEAADKGIQKAFFVLAVVGKHHRTTAVA